MNSPKNILLASSNLKGVALKNALIKKQMISHLTSSGTATLADLAKATNASIPTITKLAGELVKQKIITDNGKIETSGGRRPCIYGLNPHAMYFGGVNIAHNGISFCLIDATSNVTHTAEELEFTLEDTPRCLEKICEIINSLIINCKTDRRKIIGLGVAIPGRVDYETGQSYGYFTFSDCPLKDIIEQRTGINILLETEARAKCYAEYISSYSDAKNIAYVNIDEEISSGIIISGSLYYGKSGFAGEIGHIPIFDNNAMCSCGKIGCTETEVSNSAITDKAANEMLRGTESSLCEKYNAGEAITIEDIVEAANNGDNLAIATIEDTAEKAGKCVGLIINTLNPDAIIMGGAITRAGNYFTIPLKASASRHSSGFTFRDTAFGISPADNLTATIGAAMIIKTKLLMH